MRPGVLFDLDGTLWDATRAITPAWNRVLRPVGRPVTAADMASVMGLTVREIGAVFFPGLDEETRTGLVRSACREEVGDLRRTGGRLYPGVGDTLRALSGRYDLFVVSNCMDGYIQAFFYAHGLGQYFRDFACLGRPAQDKAANIAAICGKYRLRQAVYVGDTEGDARSAKAAGLPFFHAAYGFGHVSEADGVLRELSELPALLREIF